MSFYFCWNSLAAEQTSPELCFDLPDEVDEAEDTIEQAIVATIKLNKQNNVMSFRIHSQFLV